MNQVVLGIILLVIWFAASTPSYLETKKTKQTLQRKAEQSYMTGDIESGDMYTTMYARMR